MTALILQDYNKEAYADLMEFVDRVPLKDGDKFCAALMRESFRHKDLGKSSMFAGVLYHLLLIYFRSLEFHRSHKVTCSVRTGGLQSLEADS